MSFRVTSRLALGLGLSLSVGLVGCPPGSLEDPERFLDASAPDASASCPPGFDVEKDLFAKSCTSSLCHDDTDGGGKLNLLSPGVAARLVGVPSSDGSCGSRLLIDPTTPEQSFLLEKLTSSTPACGERMPNGPTPLPAAQIECVKVWIYGLVGSGNDSGSGGAAGGGGATDSGGGG